MGLLPAFEDGEAAPLLAGCSGWAGELTVLGVVLPLGDEEPAGLPAPTGLLPLPDDGKEPPWAGC